MRIIKHNNVILVPYLIHTSWPFPIWKRISQWIIDSTFPNDHELLLVLLIPLFVQFRRLLNGPYFWTSLLQSQASLLIHYFLIIKIIISEWLHSSTVLTLVLIRIWLIKKKLENCIIMLNIMHLLMLSLLMFCVMQTTKQNLSFLFELFLHFSFY